MRKRSAEQIAALFGKRPGDIPDERMVYQVLDLLIYYGRFLPDVDRPGKLRPWQRRALRTLLSQSRTGYEAARQAGGKTMLVSAVLVAYLILGHGWGIGMPTLEQSSGILMRRVLRWMGVLEKPLGMYRDVKNIRHVVWEHGAELRAMSTNEAGICSTQGYTYTGVVIDEAHELKWTSIGYFTPLVAVAMTRRRGKLIVVGPAGPLDSVMESCKNYGYAVEIWNDLAIADLDDAHRAGLAPGDPYLEAQPWREYFTGEEQTQDPITYNQFYRLLPVTPGGLLILPHLRSASTSWGTGGDQRFTIDVGKSVDATVLGRLVCGPNSVDLVQTWRWHGVGYEHVAAALRDTLDGFHWTPGNVGLEVNGPGEALADMLRGLDGRFGAIRRIKTTDNPGPNRSDGAKTRWLKRLIWRNLRGHLGVHEPAVRSELAALAYSVSEQGRYDWPHSDSLSVLFLNEALMQRAIGV